MPIVENKTKSKLQRGGVAIGLGVRAIQSVDIGLMARAAGFDFIFVDCEHAIMPMARAGDICTAALSQGITPLVRSAGIEAHLYAPLFDYGAQGVIVPHVDTVAEARATVAGQKFAPFGVRSMSRSSALTGYENLPIAEIVEQGNAQTLAIAMVESKEGLKNIREITAVGGLDAVLIGASDLCMDLGVPGAFGAPEAMAAYDSILSACAKAKVFCGIAGVRDDELLAKLVSQGVRLIHAGSDAPILVEALKMRSRAVRQICDEVCSERHNHG